MIKLLGTIQYRGEDGQPVKLLHIPEQSIDEGGGLRLTIVVEPLPGCTAHVNLYAKADVQKRATNLILPPEPPDWP